MNIDTSDHEALAGALEIASDKNAQTRFAGTVSPESRSIWSKMNLKVKILALAIPTAALFAMNPFSAHDAPKSPAPQVVQASVPAVALQAPALQAPALQAPALQAPALQAAVAKLATAAPMAAPVSAAKPAATPVDLLAKALGDDPNLSSYDISRRLATIDPFASLATAVEDFKRKPYYDSGGLNVGMGYCVTKRLAEYGKARVGADLTKSGFAPEQIEILLKNKRSELSKVSVTPLMATRLIDVTRMDYQNLARNAIGSDVFDKMPINRQAAMTYIAYNTRDIGQFKQLLAGLRSGSDSKAMSNMSVTWRDNAGSPHVNHRLRSYVQAMFLGSDHFKRAIEDPNAFESHMAPPEAESAMADIAAAAQKPNGLQSKILERRLKSNPWAFKAYTDEKIKKLPAPSGS